MTSLIRTRAVGVIGLRKKFADMAKRIGGAERAEMCLRGAKVIADETRRHIKRQDLIDTWALYNSVNHFKVNQWSAGVSVGAGNEAKDYAATHEYGLENQPITPRQRAYFRWRCSNEPGSVFCTLMHRDTYTIPKRPYFRPAIRQGKKDAHQAMVDYLLSVLKEYEER